MLTLKTVIDAGLAWLPVYCLTSGKPQSRQFICRFQGHRQASHPENSGAAARHSASLRLNLHQNPPVSIASAPSSLPTTAQAPAHLQLSDVSLRRGNTAVFSHLTLHLPEQRIGLIGDNGSGKSSLFRLLCGLDVPQSGTVQVRGLEARTVAAKRPGLVGMMFQNPDEQIIFPTVEEELALGLRSLPRRLAVQQARDFLQARGLAAWAGRAIGSLSQGQRQHVCWLALLIATPQLLLLDEPFASLDMPGQALLQQDIARAPQQVIVSTHALEHVRGFERVIWLQQGAVRLDGPGQQVCAAYAEDVQQRTAALVSAAITITA